MAKPGLRYSMRPKHHDAEHMLSAMGGPPSASKDNSIFPRKHMSMSEKKWGLKNSMLPLRYTHPGARSNWCMEAPAERCFDKPTLPFGGPVPCQPPLPGLPDGRGNSRFKCCTWYVKDNQAEQSAKNLLNCNKTRASSSTSSKMEIPQRDPYAGRYPYRYSSAGPARTGATKKELDLSRCRRRLEPVKEVYHDPDNFDYRDIKEYHGFETTQMQCQLKPLQEMESKWQEAVTKPNKLMRGLIRPINMKWKANDPFCQFVTDELRQDWTKDPLYLKKVLFREKSIYQDVREWNNFWHRPVNNKAKRRPLSQKFAKRND